MWCCRNRKKTCRDIDSCHLDEVLYFYLLRQKETMSQQNFKKKMSRETFSVVTEFYPTS